MLDDTFGRLLVTGDRDTAENAAQQLAVYIPSLSDEPRVVRETLAGEDDAEDAQWIVVIPAPPEGWGESRLAALEEFAVAHDGWIEIAD